jgi:hypothetical protein
MICERTFNRCKDNQTNSKQLKLTLLPFVLQACLQRYIHAAVH